MKGNFPIEKFRKQPTPFYFYDTTLLRRTLNEIRREAGRNGAFRVHYAVKANANPKLLAVIANAALGADCVSGGEISAALAAGFPASKIVFAGVGKADWEIELGIEKGIAAFNVESLPELQVINDIARRMGKTADIAFRINPDVGAHTHANITTGRAENKFGIAMDDMDAAVDTALQMSNIRFAGLHFHIGSQILDMGDFAALCNRINELQDRLESKHIKVGSINVGGGLGVSYDHPNRLAMPDFKSYFDTYARHLHIRDGQTVHFELGRAVVAQCGSLISRVLFVKRGTHKQFCILDAGFTDLIRPALYQAYHKIENLTSELPCETYDVVGPICESSDVFAKAADINAASRGDIIAIRSAGAYGEAMASTYNCRKMPGGFLAEEF
ncbi:MAG: diaminopimelate decarboxylase [Prevotella sp.]|nr:diaminopimelate decarboxylase [Prevotella sp.]